MGHKKMGWIPRSILRPFTQFLMCFVGWKLPPKIAELLAWIVCLFACLHSKTREHQKKET